MIYINLNIIIYKINIIHINYLKKKLIKLMGVPICCVNENNKEIKSEKNIISNPSPEQKRKLSNIIKIQKNFRRFLSKIKFKSYFNNAKKIIINDLDKKKLMNQNIIEECESEKIYQKLIAQEKIQPFDVQINPDLNKNIRDKNLINFYSILSKYSFNIPYYIVTSPNEVYKGSWNLNKRYHGYGIKFEFDLKNNLNKRTEGIFFDGFLTGQGIIITSEGEIFIGNFIRNQLNGEGEHHRKDKSIYKGQFKNGKYNGFGKEILNINEINSFFEGIFFEGEKKYGKFEWTDGRKYNGEFSCGIFHGFGKYNWGGKKYYQGNWDKGEIHGKGKFVFDKESFYEGEFIRGKKSGKGKYFWNKNKYYDGEWKNDKQNGYGIYYDNGKKIEGYWRNGKIINKCNLIKNSGTFMKENKKKALYNQKTHKEVFIYCKNKNVITPKKINKKNLKYNSDMYKNKSVKFLSSNTRNYFCKSSISNSTSYFKTQNTINTFDSSYIIKPINP